MILLIYYSLTNQLMIYTKRFKVEISELNECDLCESVDGSDLNMIKVTLKNSNVYTFGLSKGFPFEAPNVTRNTILIPFSQKYGWCAGVTLRQIILITELDVPVSDLECDEIIKHLK